MRVDGRVRLGVMPLDMVKISGLAEPRNFPVQQPQPIVSEWKVVPDHPKITLEMLVIDSIKPNDGGKQSHIGLSKLISQ